MESLVLFILMSKPITMATSNGEPDTMLEKDMDDDVVSGKTFPFTFRIS